jgi:hypothetical protein
MTATCSCGGVELNAVGRPIVSAVCYCDDCQRGSAQIEALPNASAVRGLALSGTAHWMFDRGLIGVAHDHQILISRHVNDIAGVRAMINKTERIQIPTRSVDQPHSHYLAVASRELLQGLKRCDRLPSSMHLPEMSTRPRLSAPTRLF